MVYSDHQRLELEKEFHYSRYITIRRKAELSQALSLSERQVSIAVDLHAFYRSAFTFSGQDLVSKQARQREETDEEAGRVDSQGENRGCCNFAGSDRGGLGDLGRPPSPVYISPSSRHVCSPFALMKKEAMLLRNLF